MPELHQALADKTLVMIVGPTAMGKSTLMNEVVRLDERFGRVGGFTTRPARSNDEPGMYRYLNDEQARELINSGDIVQSVIHPTTGVVYGSKISDYPSAFNMKDTLSTVVEELRRLPFKRTVTISLTTEPDAWYDWFVARYPEPDQERTKRLQESAQSVKWSLAQTKDHHWLVNRPDDIATTARELIDIVTVERTGTAAPAEANGLLRSIESLLSY